MKRIFTSFFILYFLSTANAKLNYNTNEWIDYEKTYYKIKVAENSICQIDFETLKTNNVPVEIIDGNQLCIFSEGKEIPIYVSNSGKWEEGDYLQFYGERLDGQFDQRLYENPDHQLHTYWSQFTDTAVYFLTVKDSSPKIIEVNNDLENLPEKENYFMHESIYVGYNQASIGVPDFQLSTLPVEGSGNEPRKFNSYLASYAEGEGWVGNSYANNTTSLKILSNLKYLLLIFLIMV